MAVLASAAAGCRRSRPRPRVAAPADAGIASGLPLHYPASLTVSAYAGAAACRECHVEIHDRWQASPHGRAMAPATANTILGRDGSVALAGGTATINGGKMLLAPGGEQPIALVLGAGRQHQEYLTQTGPDHVTLLPAFFSTKTSAWLPMALYQPGSLEPGSPDHWTRATPEVSRCPACHMSQAHHSYEDGRLHLRWVDLPINCESCHGPGRAHIAARRRDPRAKDAMKNLHAMGNREEAEICGRCHIARMSLRGADDGARGASYGMTLAFDHLRVDATQRLPSYQLPGHLTSPCFLAGAMTCSGCHDPHRQTARAQHTHASAEGDASNLQCTGCHTALASAAAVTAHSHHDGAKVRCIDCHMSRSWIGDDPMRAQETSDHSISIPRPAEARVLGLPNACVRCHVDRPAGYFDQALEKWGRRRALEIRPWVRAIAAGRARAPGAAAELAAMLDDATLGDYLHSSALELLARQPADAQWMVAIRRFFDHPQPLVRANAILAARAHDPGHDLEHRRRGFDDRERVVHIKVFEADPALATVTDADLERLLDDYFAISELFPYGGVETIGKIFAARGDRARAEALFQRTCSQGPGQACRWAAEAYSRPPLADPARAASFYLRACERGDQSSCIKRP